MTLAVNLKTFDFGFFRELCTPELYNVISYQTSSPPEVRDSLKTLYSLDENSLTEWDKLAILFFIQYHDADCEKDILKTLSETDDPDYIFFYTGKKTLTSKQRKKLLSEDFSLKNLFIDGI